MKKRILVVEDGEDLAIVLRDRFRREGYDVETVADGESALQAAEHNAYDMTWCCWTSCCRVSMASTYAANCDVGVWEYPFS
jgi:CheY-like chemotaxis protein